MKLESDIEQPAIDWAKEHGIRRRKLNGEGYRGWPDQEFFFPDGKPLLLEFKKPGEVPDRLQVFIAQQLKDANYDVRWTDKKEQAIAWLEERLQECRTSTAPVSTRGSGVERGARRRGQLPPARSR